MKSQALFSQKKKNRNAYLEMSATVVIFGLKVNQTNLPLVIKHINWVDNHQMIITTKYSSHHFTDYGAMQFNHFLIITGLLVAHFENTGFHIGSSYSKYRLFTGFSIKNIG